MKHKSTAPGTPMGITHLKELIKFIIIGVQKASTLDDNRDGRISLLEALSVITSLGFKFPAVYNSFPAAILEWKDIKPEEIDELVAWFQQEFDLPGAQQTRVKELVKECVQIIVDNYNHVQRIREILS